MYEDERVEIRPAARPTRMTALWVFLGIVALDLIVPLFRPHSSVGQCTDGEWGSRCVERYVEPAVLPPILGLVLLATLLLVLAGLLVRKWHNR